MPSVGDLVANLVADTKQWTAGLNTAKAQMSSFASYAGKTVAGIAASYATIGSAQFAIHAAESDIKATQKFEAILAATGGAAGVTSAEVNKLAGDLQRLTKFEDDATVNAAALLATFKEIKGDNFKQVLRLAQDLAATKDIGLDESVTLLGKALVEPAEGLNKLKKASVFLSDSQEILIKNLVATGNAAGAQREIIKALEQTFGGAAESTVTATEKIQIAFGHVAETIGKELLPAVNVFADRVVPAVFDTADALSTVDQEAVTLTDHLQNYLLSIYPPTAMLGAWQQFRDIMKDLDDTVIPLQENIEVIGGGFPEQLKMPNFEPSQNVEFAQDAADEFERKMQQINDDLAVMRSEMTQNEAEAQRMMRAGLEPEKAKELQKQLDLLDAQKEVERQKKEIKDKADAIRESVKTPEEVLKTKIAELKALKSSGKIDQETFDRAKKKAEEASGIKSGAPERQAVAALSKGSVEAQSAILAAGDKNNILEAQLKAQEQMADATERTADGVAELANGGGVVLMAGSLA